ncbi:unnamed protein product [Chironomus riparius]|uniref:PAN2-PAN3 deadenylation complex subunit PAN3 n=1 Tax=Chironomus riparius TaxID=315576 RepID=A0A9N9RN99_9DIPT|nr:unnamed protein product [Chironomus riparius]
MEFYANGISNDIGYMGNPNLATNTYSSLQQSSIESPISFNKKAQVSEFIPPSRLNSTSSPSFYNTTYNNTSIVNGQNATPTKNYASTSYSITPIKNNSNHRNYLRDSPQKIAPQDGSPPTIYSATNIHQENVGGTTYFYPQEQPTSYQNEETLPLPYSMTSMTDGYMYTPSPISSTTTNSHVQQTTKSFLSTTYFMSEDLRNSLLLKNEIANSVEDSSNLPIEVDNYHSLSLLEASSNLPVPSSTYKAIHSSTGIKYCLRRLHSFRIQSVKLMMQVIDIWKKFSHPNCVALREVFTTKAFGDNSLILVYDYHAGSQTLLSKYFTPTSNGYTPSVGSAFSGDARPFSHKNTLQRTANGPILQESEIWNIIIQLTCGLRAIHQANLACRTLDPTKIITDDKRLRFSFVGITDIITFDSNQQNPFQLVNHYQQDDLTALGKLIIALCCRCLQSVHSNQIQHSIDLISRHYSSDLKNLITYLLSPNKVKSIVEVMPKIGARFYTHLELLENHCDMQENELLKEMENGRLYRLLVKLGTINERDLHMDVTWSETGNRYMLKLFRDYLFHTVTEDGNPWLDMSHIVSTLNKLDAGTMEKVQLMSRDEQSVLVVTYAELKHCLDQAFNELTSFNV